MTTGEDHSAEKVVINLGGPSLFGHFDFSKEEAAIIMIRMMAKLILSWVK
jgi:hypothetical protein